MSDNVATKIMLWLMALFFVFTEYSVIVNAPPSYFLVTKDLTSVAIYFPDPSAVLFESVGVVSQAVGIGLALALTLGGFLD